MSKLWAFVSRLWIALFGRVKWEAPGWTAFAGRKGRATGSWARAHKGPALAIALGVAALGGGGFAGVR